MCFNNHNFPKYETKQTATYEEIPHDLASMDVCMRQIASLASALIIVKVSINIGRSAYNIWIGKVNIYCYMELIYYYIYWYINVMIEMYNTWTILDILIFHNI